MKQISSSSNVKKPVLIDSALAFLFIKVQASLRLIAHAVIDEITQNAQVTVDAGSSAGEYSVC